MWRQIEKSGREEIMILHRGNAEGTRKEEPIDPEEKGDSGPKAWIEN